MAPEKLRIDAERYQLDRLREALHDARFGLHVEIALNLCTLQLNGLNPDS
ncbi:hypothetical protein ODS41_12470 [Pyrobaculum sp. 3827-6]|nr:hypothetical protein [Pyrobaculum sp. 3827-6]MCU7788727.1 hypothetical protein [Pyrobaculum sp. 3827-6]